MAAHFARGRGFRVRHVILIILFVCGACLAVGDLVARIDRAGAGPQPPTIMQPPVTQAELDSRCQARAAELQREQADALAPATPPPAPPTRALSDEPDDDDDGEFACDADFAELAQASSWEH